MLNFVQLEKKEEENKKISQQLTTWLSSNAPSTRKQQNKNNDVQKKKEIRIGDRISDSDDEALEDNEILLETTDTDTDAVSDTDTDNIQQSIHQTENPDQQNQPLITLNLDFNDPMSWPTLNDKIRCLLVEHGPDQGKDFEFIL